jgi:DNA-binding transcriptional ArsR family regulator
MSGVALLDQPDRVRLALSPLRRRLLERLRTPASASQIALELTLGRQRVNYHLRALEHAGLLELVEKRQRRGCTERVLVTRARLFVVDPGVIEASDTPSVTPAAQETAAQDRFAADSLIAQAATTVREVARMQARAQDQGTRLLTFSIDTELQLSTPADLERLANRLAAFVASEAAALDHSGGGGRRYRLVLGAHPAPARTSGATHEPRTRTRSRASRTARRRAH